MARSRITHPTIDSANVKRDARDDITVNELELDPSKWSDEKKAFYQKVARALGDFGDYGEGEPERR
jgi:hypothetical protein